MGQKERLGKERVGGDGGVGAGQAVQAQRWTQLAGVPDLQPVGKKHHLDAGIAGVVAVGNGIDQGLGHHRLGDLVAHRRLRSLFPRTHRAIELGHDKIHRLIGQLKDRTLVDVIGGDRLAQFGTVKMGAFHLRGEEEALRRRAEE